MTKEQEAIKSEFIQHQTKFFNSMTKIEAKIPEYLKHQIAVVVSPFTEEDKKISS